MSPIKCAHPDCPCKKGTPPDLREAIKRGYNAIDCENGNGDEAAADSILPAVLDRLRQDFGAAYLKMSALDPNSLTVALQAMEILVDLSRRIGVVEAFPASEVVRTAKRRI